MGGLPRWDGVGRLVERSTFDLISLFSHGVRLDSPSKPGFERHKMSTRPDKTRRIDRDHLDESPSTGAEQVARANHAVYGLGEPEPRATIENDEHLKDFFGVSS